MSGWNLSKGSCWNFTTVLRELPGFQLWGEIWCSQGHSRRAGKETRGLPPSSFLLRLVCSTGAVLPTFMFPSSKWVVPRSSLYFSCWKFGMVLQTEQCWKRWQVSTAVQLQLVQRWSGIECEKEDLRVLHELVSLVHSTGIQLYKDKPKLCKIKGLNPQLYVSRYTGQDLWINFCLRVNTVLSLHQSDAMSVFMGFH